MKNNCPYCGKEIEIRVSCESDEVVLGRRKESDGYVYLVHSPTNDVYKIGRAKRVDGRYGSIARQSPVEVRLIHAFKSSDSKEADKKLHEAYRSKRVIGEWFSLSHQEVESFVSIEDYGM